MKNNNYLKEKIKNFNPNKIETVENALNALKSCSFQGRNLGKALEILTEMLSVPRCFKVLSLSGAMVPAGMEEIICQGIENNVFDAIVTTGANIIHSIVNSYDVTNQAHYLGSKNVSDKDLYNLSINRIYDTYLPENNYKNAENHLLKLISTVYSKNTLHIIYPSELFKIIGKNMKKTSFLRTAADKNIPIFCGATSDSELSINLLKYRKFNNYNIILDEIGDIDNFAEKIEQYDKYGIVIIGGGVPRNWSQQIFPYLEQIKNKRNSGYNYAVRLHTATEYDGGLSGCTVSESVSWGKYSKEIADKSVSVWVDSTIGFPLLMTALFQRMRKKN
ncbi:deoxyhypusine synthase family protein [Promethearchaeum syntrophicum]|uniref:Deoxyhypusine synthase family protein n=1 Tax=Promethearchaeum syntrophicum TaxID=2594042 RepID=A0A5B9DCH2_9ARCH|nr:deoxyhypusine synthase family protein [Candidatus Prometheoarchaeum syntrophicum]QEE16406.1 putative deoxyhypusine synthase [Candidatus Prometheoarchaeum syntrophicum]